MRLILYLYSVCFLSPYMLCYAMLCSIAHSIICTRLFPGKMHSDCFKGIEIFQASWQHGEKVGYNYHSGLDSVYRWVHTCDVTAYRNTVSWRCWRDSWPRNVSKVGYAVTLRACSARCRYLAVASKEWYGYGLSRSGRATWHVTTTAVFSYSLKRNVYKCTKPLLAAKTSLGLLWQTGNPNV
jgi:hypothetical protein